jgi:TolB-like protein
MKSIKLTIFILLIILFTSFSANAAKTVLILPFSIYSEKDMSFLKDGLYDMVSTRIAGNQDVNIVEKTKSYDILSKISVLNDETAAIAGKKISADYVAFGSLTIVGNSISTNIKFIDVKTKTPLVMFSKASEKQGDIISHAELFAIAVNSKVFGAKVKTSVLEENDKIYESRKHPDNLILDIKEIQNQILLKIKEKINGIAVADVNGDAKNEVILLTDHAVKIYKFDMGRLIKLSEIKGVRASRYITLDACDINNNGIAEIFVTNLVNPLNEPKSFVFEWNGNEYEKIDSGLNMFLRTLENDALETNDRGSVLLGQKRGLHEYEDVLNRNVYEIQWKNGKYEKTKKIHIPVGISVLGLNYADAFMIGFTSFDKLAFIDADGDKSFESTEHYGGGFAFIERKSGGDSVERQYLPLRILCLDGSIIVANNESAGGRLFSGLRAYKNSHMICLKTDNIGFAKKWETRKFKGYISDYVIADINNDGEKEILFVNVSKKGSLFKSSVESSIFHQKLK